MGEMADYYLDLEGYYEDENDHLPEDEEDSNARPYTVICRCCHTPGLVWEQLDGKWRLFTSDLFGNPLILHHCPAKPLPEHR